MICFNRKSTHSTPVIELQRSKQYKDGKKAKVYTAVVTYDVFQHIFPEFPAVDDNMLKLIMVVVDEPLKSSKSVLFF